MSEDFASVASRVNPLLESTHGMTLKHAQLLKEGIRFVYEDAQVRKVIILQPKVYTDGAVIVDAINDVVLVMAVSTYDLKAYQKNAANTEPLEQTSIEMPYSIWLFEGNYR